MNTTEAKQDLLGRFRNVATVAHFRKRRQYFITAWPFRARGRSAHHPAREGLVLRRARHSLCRDRLVRYDGAISLLDRATIRTSRNTVRWPLRLP